MRRTQRATSGGSARSASPARRLRASRSSRSTSATPGEEAVVDGVAGTWRVDPRRCRRGRSTPRTALLSPFDRLVFDRERADELFGFEYILEMYKPAAKRRWGYFALPILHGDRLVGKLDATADRKAGVFRVTAIHEDAPFTDETTDAVHHEIRELADWLGLEVAGLP